MKNKILSVMLSGLLLVSSDIANFKVNAAGEEECAKHISLTKAQVIEDIDFVLDVIKQNHVAAIEKIPDEVLTQKEIEISKLQENLSVVEEWKIISRIASKLHTAHTWVSVPIFLWNRLPFDTEMVNKQFFCKSGDLKDFQITAINGISVEDLYENFKKHFSYEIEERAQYVFFENPSTFITGCKLEASGINTSEPVEVTFKKGSEIINRKFDLISIEESGELSEPWVSYKIDKENSVATFTLNECICDEKYLENLKNFFCEVHENNIENIVVDLRKNCGGNSSVQNYFAACLKNFNYDEVKKFIADVRKGDTINLHVSYEGDKDAVNEFRKSIELFDGNVFILTSHATFSSGMQFATFFSDNNWAKIVGEVPGNSPTSFGDLTQWYTLPNSKLCFQTCFKKFYRPDPTKNPDRLIPDVEVSAKYALEKVYEIIESCSAE